MFYPHGLGDMFIEPHIHKYTSPLNRVLVDYKLLMKETMVVIDKKKEEMNESPYLDPVSPRIGLDSQAKRKNLTRGISEVMSAV